MARNYSFAEAVEILTHHEDLEACADIGKRYPLLAQKIARVGVKAGEDFVELAGFIPEHISANKVNSAIKRTLEESADEEDDVEEETPKKKAPKEQVKKTGKAGRPKKVDEDIEDDDDDTESDYDSMNNKQMYDLLGKMGKRKDCKEKFGDLSHDSMLKYLKKYGNATAEAEDDDEEESESTDYSGMKAMELYKLCKQRKIKAEAKKPAKYYIDLLKKADAAEAEDVDDEDWEDDEDEVEEAPKKPAKAAKKEAKKPAAKKAAKKSEPEDDEDEDDDDDEWDI